MEEPPNGYFSERMIIDQEILGSLFSDQPILLLQSSFSSILVGIRGTSLVELDDDQVGTRRILGGCEFTHSLSTFKMCLKNGDASKLADGSILQMTS